MSDVLELPDGSTVDRNDVETRRRCEFCETIVPRTEEMEYDQILVLSLQGGTMDVCLGCLKEGLEPTAIRDNLKRFGQGVIEQFDDWEGPRKWDDE